MRPQAQCCSRSRSAKRNSISTAANLPTWELYLFGCLGGLITGLLLYVVPELIHAARTGKFAVGVTPGRVAIILILLLILAAISGVAPLIPAHVTRAGPAIAYGVGGTATLKGILQGAQDALKP